MKAPTSCDFELAPCAPLPVSFSALKEMYSANARPYASSVFAARPRLDSSTAMRGRSRLLLREGNAAIARRPLIHRYSIDPPLLLRFEADTSRAGSPARQFF